MLVWGSAYTFEQMRGNYITERLRVEIGGRFEDYSGCYIRSDPSIKHKNGNRFIYEHYNNKEIKKYDS